MMIRRICITLFLLIASSEYGVATEPFAAELNVTVTGNNSLKFFFFGDWGGIPNPPYFSSAQKNFAEGIGKLGNIQQPQFILSLGDHFYENGVTEKGDSRFWSTFENVYTADSLQVPWYPIAGNHDHRGSVQAQIDYTELSNRWIYPNFFYTLHYRSIDGITTDIVMVDSILFCNKTSARKWVQRKLHESNADYLFVAGHYPVYSGGKHGNDECLIQQLQPLMRQYRATAYLAGHEHDLEHITFDEPGEMDGVHYFVSGTGTGVRVSLTDHNRQKLGANLKFFYGDFVRRLGGVGFVELKDSLNGVISFWNTAGTLLYQTPVQGRYTEERKRSAN